MFSVNEYFNGNVKSLAFNAGEDKATVGVMAVGEYEFGTDTVEHMTLISGAMAVILPGADQWRTIGINETFVVEADVKFKVRIDEESAYLCIYK
ncbi:MAG: pyrimidine/purine nucleoside phosphorylase [Gammaproteobacteria bacterium]|nr:pyrimidine/purine nucleoside phosphorylase [Gammaproteobacteria bacterium]